MKQLGGHFLNSAIQSLQDHHSLKATSRGDPIDFLMKLGGFRTSSLVFNGVGGIPVKYVRGSPDKALESLIRTLKAL